ncbi:MAG: phosphoribosylanthranilate isomerase [Oscillospiraceae bacterium]|nr:phosphoribosylanthranilate isomerase [Oscillospiraceae bacterium]
MLKVKICGLMREDDVRMCITHGTDIIGFVVGYPKYVPWDIDAQKAKKLISLVKGSSAAGCIVTGGAPEKIIETALETEPDYVQLHYGESLEDTAYIANKLKPCGIKIIKTLFPDTPNLEKTAAEFCKLGVYALLFDPRTPENAAAGGGGADISVYTKLKAAADRPVILAGGITPENAAELVCKSGACIIDLMTGVESRPGVKDEKKVKSLFKALENIKNERSGKI